MYYISVPKSFTPVFSSAGRFATPDEHVHPKRCLDSAVLLVGYSGECPIAQDGRGYILSKGCAMLLFPGCEHCGTGKTPGAQSHFWCHFYLPEGFAILDEEQAKKTTEDCFVIPEFFRLPDFEKFCVLFPQMIDAAEASYTDRELRSAICSGYVKILLAELCEGFMKDRNSEKSGGTAAVIASKVCEWIRLNAARGISASDAAKALGYNSDYLSMLLKRETGHTLGNLINQTRIREAKKLLLNSGMKISEIAYAVGFGDEKYFMKVFRKLTGVTAREYRGAHFREHRN